MDFHLKAALRQNLVTIDIVDILQPSAALYQYGGITIFAVLLFQSNTQRAMQFGCPSPKCHSIPKCLALVSCNPARRRYILFPKLLKLKVNELSR
jgi:hypothetical protein